MSDFLTIEGVSKSFGAVKAVNAVSLGIGSGEIFSLLGPSGCGKTTILRMIAGFEAPDTGRVLLDGVDITALSPEKRPVNTIFQNYALFPHLSVFGNIEFGLKIKKVSKSTREKEVARVLELVKLEDKTNAYPNELSGGQKQRVAIARALINRPKVLLLDEPLAALDLKLREHMLSELRAIQREVGITFLYVTHDQGEALSISSRVSVMNQGVIEQIGTPEEIYKNPFNYFVSSFVGEMNFFEGKVQGGDSIFVEKIGESLKVPAKGFPLDSEVVIGIRPEAVSLDSNVESHNGFKGKVLEKAYFGSSVKVICSLGDNRIVSELPASNLQLSSLMEGSDCRVYFDESSLHVFPGLARRQ